MMSWGWFDVFALALLNSILALGILIEIAKRSEE